MAEGSNKKALVIGVCLATILGLQGCASQPEKPVVKECKDLEWNKEADTWKCNDKSSSHYRSYYYGGGFYSNQNALKTNPSYKSYLSKGGSGFGKGSGSFGG